MSATTPDRVARLAIARHPGARLIGVGFLFGLARFSESFLILKAMDVGLAPAWSPLALAMFSLAFLVLAYPAGALSDRMEPRSVLLAGIAVLIAANLWLAQATTLWAVFAGIALWGAHMALTQGIFARMIADAAAEHQRATSFGAFFFASGICCPARQPRRRAAVGSWRPGRDLHRRGGGRGAGWRDAVATARPPLGLPASAGTATSGQRLGPRSTN